MSNTTIPQNMKDSMPSIQMSWDLFCLMPIYWAGKYTVTVLNPEASGNEQAFASAKARLLCVTQGVVSLVNLPFKFLAAIFMGISLLFRGNFSDYGLSTGYSLLSVGFHAMMVPASIILACMPSKVVADGVEWIRNADTNIRTWIGTISDRLQEATQAIAEEAHRASAQSSATPTGRQNS